MTSTIPEETMDSNYKNLQTEFYSEMKKEDIQVHLAETISQDDEKRPSNKPPPATARELVAEILTLDDDPSVNPWTFRMWFIGIGMSVFAGILTTISEFKPQAVGVHLVFVAVVTYVIGNMMAFVLPSKGRIGRLINPGPFNKKEHSAICIMSAAAASTPEAMMVLAVQKLYYNIEPSATVGVFLILSTQMLGYGVAGLLRKTLVYPSNMLYPTNLPTASLLESLHQDGKQSGRRLRVFHIAFFILFAWQVFPLYIAPLFAGISIFCLTMRHNMVITNLFGGLMANEGLGTLALSFDWTQVSAHGNPLWVPFQTIMNYLIGYVLSIGIYMGLYYSNTWNARRLPFLSQLMYSDKSTSAKYVKYNQTQILDSNYRIDNALLEKHHLPVLTASHAFGMTMVNIGISAAIIHMILWHWPDIKSAFPVKALFRRIINVKSWTFKFWKTKATNPTDEEADAIDPHYRLMMAYSDVPSWWFGLLWVMSALIGLITSRLAKSDLEWWAFLTAILVSSLILPFFAAMNAMFGFKLNVQPLMSLVGGYLLPGRPLANLYFSTFGYNSLYQAKLLLQDMKLGQYVHLAPKCTFEMQITGTVIGCLMSYLMMKKITTEKRDILLSIQGTNIWSGQKVQKENSAAITWGGLAHLLYGLNGRYPWVSLGFLIGIVAPIPFFLAHKYMPRLRLNYLNLAIICGGMNLLSHGTHSGFFFHYLTGFISQFWLRRYRTNWFLKYNYVLSAGMDGGTAVISFLLTFAVFGAGGRTVPFPKYWANNRKGNLDYCMRDPGLGAGKSGKH